MQELVQLQLELRTQALGMQLKPHQLLKSPLQLDQPARGGDGVSPGNGGVA